jgi:hypothetical protein
MMCKPSTHLLVGLLGLISFAGVTGAFLTTETSAASPPEQRSKMVRVVGTAVGEIRDLSALTSTPGASESLCFDVEVIDAETGRWLGTATDCLFDITEVGDGLALSAITIFNLPGGTLFTEGRTSVQPTTTGSPDITHITGAIPLPDSETFVLGTGRFAGIRGNARLSGAVNLSRLEQYNEITFDCLFSLNFRH